MMLVDSTLPSLDQFLQLSTLEIKEYMTKFEIRSIYYAIDGTRRFILSEYPESTQTNFLNFYIEKVQVHTVNAFRLLARYFSDIYFLLNDLTAFVRGKEYLDVAINTGVAGLGNNPKFLEFYEEDNVKISFVGFNEIYREYGYESIFDLMNKIQQKTTENSKVNLFAYTGYSLSKDPIKLLSHFREENDLKTVKKKIYGMNAPDIDVGVFFGVPRSKIEPILLNDNMLRLYTHRPSLALTERTIRKAIYYSILYKNGIKDQYIRYENNGLPSSKHIELIDDKNEDFIGERYYMEM